MKGNEKERISFRVDVDLRDILIKISNANDITLSWLCEYLVIKGLTNLDMKDKLSYYIGNMDFKEIAKHLESIKNRKLVRLIKHDLNSKFMFIDRMKMDLARLSSKKRPKKDLMLLFNVYEKEAKLFPNNEDLLKEIEYFKTKNIKNIADYTRLVLDMEMEKNKPDSKEIENKIKKYLEEEK